jgi:hypothetical protein
MALMFPRAFRDGETGERLVYEALRHELDDLWWVFHDRIIVAHGEEGRVDFILMHRERGLALLAVVEGDEEIAEEPAREALRTMLADRGFERVFGGLPPVVVLAVDPARLDDLGGRIGGAFAGTQADALADPDWPEWVADVLTREDDLATSTETPPAAAAAPEPLENDDSPRFAGRRGELTVAALAVGVALMLLAAVAVAWSPDGAASTTAVRPEAAVAGTLAPAGGLTVKNDAEASAVAAPAGNSVPPGAAEPANDAGGTTAVGYPLPPPAKPAPPPRAIRQSAEPRSAGDSHGAAHRAQPRHVENKPWWRRVEPGGPQLNQNNRAN